MRVDDIRVMEGLPGETHQPEGWRQHCIHYHRLSGRGNGRTGGREGAEGSDTEPTNE